MTGILKWSMANSGSCLFVWLPRSQLFDQETKLGIWQLSVPAESDLASVLMNISHISYRSSTGSAQYHRGWLEYFFSYKLSLPLWNWSIHSACRACQAPQRRPQCWRHRDDCYHLVKFWGLSGHSMHVRYAPSFLRLVGTSFKRVPVDCSSLRQFTLCMPSSPILSNSGHFVTSSTVSCAIWFESLLLYRIYHSNTKSGWVCPYLRSQSLLVCIFLIPKRWCGVGTRTARFLDLDWNVLG